MVENHPDTAPLGWTSMAWYDAQMEGALPLLGADKMAVESYSVTHVREGDDSSPKILRLTLRTGQSYWFYNFEGWVQLAEVTTEEQKAEQRALLKMMFG